MDYFQQWLAERYENFRAAVYRRWGETGLEALHECLVTILQRKQVFQSVEHVQSWLWVCVRRRVIDELRRRRRHPDALGNQDPAGPDQPRMDDFDQLQAVFCACYLALNENQRHILRRYYRDGLSVAEIAAENQCTEPALRSRLFQARRRLRECLQQHEVFYDDLLDVMLCLVVFDCENNPPVEDTR